MIPGRSSRVPPVRRPQPRLFRRGNGEPGTGLAEEEAVVPEWDLAEGWAPVGAWDVAAGVSGTASGEDSDIILSFIPDERVRELFAEENRRLTLMRTGTLPERAKLNKEATIKGTISGPDQRIMLWPVPLSEIQRNKDVAWQNNPGY